jgi:aspartate-semialdehyde dehydrogenase
MTHSAKQSNLFTVALVGAVALKGKEVRDVLSERSFPAVDVKLLDEDDALGQLDQVNDEPAFIQAVLPEHLEGVDFAFLTADESFITKVWASVRDSGSEIIDLSYALENNTDVVLRAPWVEKEFESEAERELQKKAKRKASRKVEHKPDHALRFALQSTPVVIAHPAAVVLALLLGRLKTAAPLRLASAVIGQPASEYGRRGMDELHDQTVNLLSFQQMPTACFGTQAAFNIFGQSIATAHPSLAETEARILRHFRAIAGQLVAEPAVLLVQAPVFHGYAIAIFVQTASAATPEALEAALAGPHVTVAAGQEDFPSNVNVAGSPEILVSLRPDGAGGNGFWLFAACDNLRLSAIQAVECAEEMVHTRPRGQLQ